MRNEALGRFDPCGHHLRGVAGRQHQAHGEQRWVGAAGDDGGAGAREQPLKGSVVLGGESEEVPL